MGWAGRGRAGEPAMAKRTYNATHLLRRHLLPCSSSPCLASTFDLASSLVLHRPPPPLPLSPPYHIEAGWSGFEQVHSPLLILIVRPGSHRSIRPSDRSSWARRRPVLNNDRPTDRPTDRPPVDRSPSLVLRRRQTTRERERERERERAQRDEGGENPQKA